MRKSKNKNVKMRQLENEKMRRGIKNEKKIKI